MKWHHLCHTLNPRQWCDIYCVFTTFHTSDPAMVFFFFFFFFFLSSPIFVRMFMSMSVSASFCVYYYHWIKKVLRQKLFTFAFVIKYTLILETPSVNRREKRVKGEREKAKEAKKKKKKKSETASVSQFNRRMKMSADADGQSYGVSDVNENPLHVFCILI